MTNPKDEIGKGPPRPGDASAGKRPYATLDLQATDVDQSAKAKANTDTASADQGPQGTSVPRSDFAARARAAAASAADLAARFRPTGSMVSHLGAGAAGALIVLLGSYLLSPGSGDGQARAVRDLARRVADAEAAVTARPADAAEVRAKVDGLDRSLRTLSDAQAKLASDAKAMDSRIGSGGDVPQEIVARIAKLEEAQSPPSGSESGEAAKTARANVDSEFAAIRTEAGRLGQRLDALRGELDDRMRATVRSVDIAPLQAKLALIDKELQRFLEGESDRSATSTRVLLSLELASLKRVMDRSEPFTAELAAVKKAAGDKLDLKALERYANEGVPTTAEITKSFRKVSNAMQDAEAEPADASIVDRLLSGARSIVRVRKSGPSADDTSLDATITRIDVALKDGRLTEVLEQGKKLPPKAALVAEDWLRQVEARQAVDQATADIEGLLKSSLAGKQPTAVEPRR
jgi:hypothetical protein